MTTVYGTRMVARMSYFLDGSSTLDRLPISRAWTHPFAVTDDPDRQPRIHAGAGGSSRSSPGLFDADWADVSPAVDLVVSSQRVEAGEDLHVPRLT